MRLRNVFQLRHAGAPRLDCSVPGLEVTELPWEDSGWLFEAQPESELEEHWLTLVNWRVCLSGCLEGQVLHHPHVSYAGAHRTERIVEVRMLENVRQPLAFAADGWCYRLRAPSEDHNHRQLAREWLDMMLGEDATLPLVALRIAASVGRRIRADSGPAG